MSFLGLGLPVAALSSDAAGAVEAHRGKVLVKSDSGWDALGTDALEAGDVIRTGKDGEIILKFPGESRVRLAANSQLQVTSVSDKGASVLLERGRVLGNAHSALNVATCRTSTRASEGEFVLETTADGTKLNVLDGNAQMTSENEIALGDVETLPEGVEASELAGMDGVGDIQVEGQVAANASEGNGQDEGDEEEDDDDDKTAWALGGASALIIAGVFFAMSGDGDDDERVGTPSPNLP